MPEKRNVIWPLRPGLSKKMAKKKQGPVIALPSKHALSPAIMLSLGWPWAFSWIRAIPPRIARLQDFSSTLLYNIPNVRLIPARSTPSKAIICAALSYAPDSTGEVPSGGKAGRFLMDVHTRRKKELNLVHNVDVRFNSPKTAKEMPYGDVNNFS